MQCCDGDNDKPLKQRFARKKTYRIMSPTTVFLYEGYSQLYNIENSKPTSRITITIKLKLCTYGCVENNWKVILCFIYLYLSSTSVGDSRNSAWYEAKTLKIYRVKHLKPSAACVQLRQCIVSLIWLFKVTRCDRSKWKHVSFSIHV